MVIQNSSTIIEYMNKIFSLGSTSVDPSFYVWLYTFMCDVEFPWIMPVY